MIFRLIRCLTYASPFVLLCIASRKVNLKRAKRAYQFLMPLIALIYCGGTVFYLREIEYLFLRLLKMFVNYVPFLNNINWNRYLIYICNAILIMGFLTVKGIALPMLQRVWAGSKGLMESTAGRFYEFEEDIQIWVVKPEYGQVRFYCSGLYYAALAVSTIVFVMSQAFYEKRVFQATFYPAFGMIVLGEVVNYLSGLTKSEVVEDILGEDEESYKIANYGLLRGILKNLFGERVLYDATISTGLGIPPTFEMLEEMCKSEDPVLVNLGCYFKNLRECGENIEPNYVKSCVSLVKGKSVLFCNPFYGDLADYVIFPMMNRLMQYRKCLVIVGRESIADDLKEWLEQSIVEKTNTKSLWKVSMLDQADEDMDSDIVIMRFSDLYNLGLHKKNEEFLRRVGFVFIVEPSRLLATGQIGLRLLISRFDESNGKVVYCACDRNCDGLVDALSHTLKVNLTEVAATSKSSVITSMMCWKAEGEYMHHKIFSNISRYLGVGTEINAVALKYQISNAGWFSNDKFPVRDMKWIVGQYYNKVCNYANLPLSQEVLNDTFHVESNLWSSAPKKNYFMVVEDEFQNLFEMVRLFSTRALQQGFVNVISENYLLRDYMVDNYKTFLADPKAVPTIVADYARTERNTILQILMQMTMGEISEEEVTDIFMVNGIKVDDTLETIKRLIHKHCFIDEINIRVYFREELLEDAFRVDVKKYYAIEEQSEIAEYTRNLRNAYYIVEDEKGELHHVGARLYGHVFQAMLPGQFLTFEGKYYEVQTITPKNGVVLRRAADYITGRKYYRQIRHIVLSEWQDDESVGGQKMVEGVRIDKGYCQLTVHTSGYLEMESYENLKTAKMVCVSGIPSRTYRNKLVLKIIFPEISDHIRYTISLFLNEIFKTVYPETYQFICAVTPTEIIKNVPGNIQYAMYFVESTFDDNGIYIVEDSEIDLGLITSVERNLKRYLEIITEVLIWHDNKMKYIPKREPEQEYVPEFDPEPEKPTEKEGFFRRIINKIKTLLGIKMKKRDEEEAEEEKVPKEKEPLEEPSAEKASEEENSLKGESAAAEDIERKDEELTETKEITEYQKNHFLKFGYREENSLLDLEGTKALLLEYGYGLNPLTQARDKEALAEEYEKSYDPHKKNTHFCDFCGVELAGGEYDLLKDGRERCNRCSMTALGTGEEFREVYRIVLRQLEIFFGVQINCAIKVRMVDAEKIAEHFGGKFVATPGYDGRTIGFAQKDSTGYSLYIENGSPKLSAMATIAHELTHIWQYQNWNDKEIIEKYGAHNRLEIYEGMAKWVEVQYLLYLNEVTYAKREEIVTRMREDEYGRGFIKYVSKYSLSYEQEKKRTPFDIFPPL